MARTAADQVAEMMIDVGIQRVYGVVGDSINSIVDAIRRSDGKLRWVHCRNEEVAAFAAGADALLTGQIADTISVASKSRGRDQREETHP